MVRFFEEKQLRLSASSFLPKKTPQNLEDLDTAENRDTDAVLFKDRSQCRNFFPQKDTELARRAAVLLALTRELTSGIQKRKADKEHQFFASSFSPKKLLSTCVFEQDFKDTKEVEKSSGLMATMQADQENHRVGQEYHYLE